MGKEKSSTKNTPNLASLFSNFSKEEQSNIINNILHLGLKSLEKKTQISKDEKSNRRKNIESEESSDNETITIDSKSDNSNEDYIDNNTSYASSNTNNIEIESFSNNSLCSSRKSSKSSTTMKPNINKVPKNEFSSQISNDYISKYPYSQNISEYMSEYVEKRIDYDDIDDDNIPIYLNPDENNQSPVILDRLPINSNYENYSVYPEWWGCDPEQENGLSSKKGTSNNKYQRKMIDESIQVTLTGHSYINKNPYKSFNNGSEKNKPERTKVQYFKCNKSPGKKPWKPQSTQTDDLDDYSDNEYRGSNRNLFGSGYGNGINGMRNKLSNHPRINTMSPSPRYPKKKSEFYTIPFFDSPRSAKSKPPLPRKPFSNSVNSSPRKQNNSSPNNVDQNSSPIQSPNNDIKTPTMPSNNNMNNYSNLPEKYYTQDNNNNIDDASIDDYCEVKVDPNDHSINIRYSPGVKKDSNKNNSPVYKSGQLNNNNDDYGNSYNNNKDYLNNNYNSIPSLINRKNSPYSSINNIKSPTNKDSKIKNSLNNLNPYHDSTNSYNSLNSNKYNNNYNSIPSPINRNSNLYSSINNLKSPTNNNKDIIHDNDSLIEGNSLFSNSNNSNNNNNNKISLNRSIRDSPKQKIKEKIRKHILNSKMDKPLYNRSYPIINTISDSDIEADNTYSSSLSTPRQKHSHSSRSNASNLSQSQSSNTSFRSSLINRKENKRNGHEDGYNNISMPSPDMSEKIKNNHLKLNEENIYISPKQLNQNRMYNNRETSDIISMTSSQYTNESKPYTNDSDYSSSYYTYTTSNSYFMSEMDYTNDSRYSDKTPKTNKTMDEMKKQKYNESIINNNLDRYLIFDKNENESSKMRKNEKHTEKLSSNSLTNHHHRRHRHHHHRRHKNSTYSSSDTKSKRSDYSSTYSITTGSNKLNQENMDDEYYSKKKIQEYLISSNKNNKEKTRESESIVEDYNIKEIIPNDLYISDVYTESYSNDVTSNYDKMSGYNSNNLSIHDSNNDLKLNDDKENIISNISSIGSLHSKNITNNSYLSNNNTVKSSNYPESMKSSSNKDMDKLTIFDIANNYVNSKTLKLLDITE